MDLRYLQILVFMLFNFKRRSEVCTLWMLSKQYLCVCVFRRAIAGKNSQWTRCFLRVLLIMEKEAETMDDPDHRR